MNFNFKSVFSAVLALGTIAVSSNALADSNSPFSAIGPVVIPVTVISQPEVQIPENLTTLEAMNEWALQYGMTQMTELAWYDAQTKYYEILRASYLGSKALSDAFNAKASKDTVKNVGQGVTIIADAYLVKAWLAGAAPTAQMIKDVWLASRGETGRMTAIGKKTFQSLLEVGKSLKIPKNFVTTAAIGTFAYVQYETYFVINMSEAQYEAEVKSLDMKIESLQKIKASIADRHTNVPVSVR